ncbi:thiolase domain-containing protein [Martelella mediterranea]|uniref:Acetyl-CoA acetyltransferase n=1 Tax=Martelella mediterranea DSM 17316 TaxID=1122214 RepID=A0A1U9Z5Z8_9HYPH|nr:thiolase domain-containing protein [Martelella mediterranea]AQZ53084.1 acetyl-CoA acetyltransferase [Martelella mediterranea DSM 17316]
MARIIGWGHTPFGRLAETLPELVVAAGREALEHSGVPASEIGGIWLGHFNSGMVGDAFASSLALDIDPDLRFTPATRLENACASGSAALWGAIDAVEAGRVDAALVIGVEKMTHLTTPEVTAGLAGASDQREEAGVSFPEIFARFARAYAAEYGDMTDALARIAVKNHANAMANPLAQMHKPLDFDFCREVSNRNPMIADPLKVTDCSLISDGAAALVITRDEAARGAARAVAIRARSQVSDFLPMSRRSSTELTGAAIAIRQALEAAGLGIRDIDAAEVHDCFTIAELMVYEAMGLAAPGEGHRAIEEGWVARDGILPVNLSGGLKAKGHPVGATGVSMHVMAARQVLGEAGDMQRAGAERALVFNMGGSGVANYASVLEAAAT